MKTVLLTGAFGNVGQSALKALRELGHAVRAFEYPSRRNKAMAGHLCTPGELIWGDIRNPAEVMAAARDVDAIIHLAALIPPGADRNPGLARQINVGGTANVLAAARASDKNPRLVFSSSVATYGDRVKNFFIRTDDPLAPCPDDVYAAQKVECEALVRNSGLPWVICRLSYIVWRKKLAMDSLMFRMPLDTRLEVCHTEDTGLALARAAFCDQALGGTYNLAGGPSCRTSFREYLDRMLAIFGLGGVGFLPEEAFSQTGYHCGYMDTEDSERLFRYQRKTLEDYYAEVEEEARPVRFWARMFRPLARASVLARSPYLRAYLAERGMRAILHPAAARLESR